MRFGVVNFFTSPAQGKSVPPQIIRMDDLEKFPLPGAVMGKDSITKRLKKIEPMDQTTKAMLDDPYCR